MPDQNDLFAVVPHADLDLPRLWQVLERWQQQGWIRALDLALARWLAELDPQARPPLLLAATLTSHQLGRGHICLDLPATLADPDAALSLPPEGVYGEQLPDRPVELLGHWTEADWVSALLASVLVGQGPGNQPLVLERGGAGQPARLYLRRQWQYEVAVARYVRERLGAVDNLDQDALREGLQQLFPHAVEAGSVDWQKLACALAAQRRFSIITGGPGTGKTTTVVRLLALLQSQAVAAGKPLRIRLAAPTGKAAARLTESISGAVGRLPEVMRQAIPTEVTTLHRLLGSRPDSRHFRHHAGNPLHADLVVVDEASMIDLEMMHSLLQALPPRARLVLLGDKDQLASVEAGAVLGDLCTGADRGGYSAASLQALEALSGQPVTAWQQQAGQAGQQALAQSVAMLRVSHRFGADSGIGALARAINGGQPQQARSLLRQQRDDLALLEPRADGSDLARKLRSLVLGAEGYRPWLELLAQRPADEDYQAETYRSWAQALLQRFAGFRLLCALRRGPWGVEGVNASVEQLLQADKWLSVQGDWYHGRPVMLTRNDYGLGLMNGDIGLTLALPDGRGGQILRVVFALPGDQLKWVLPSRLQQVETVYAMTVHKAQGSEFAHTVLILPAQRNPVLTRELVYTGITRASARFTLLLPVAARLDEAVRTPVHRASALRHRLLD